MPYTGATQPEASLYDLATKSNIDKWFADLSSRGQVHDPHLKDGDFKTVSPNEDGARIQPPGPTRQALL